jgi:capsular exopolysaccharide synthesis family protein
MTTMSSPTPPSAPGAIPLHHHHEGQSAFDWREYYHAIKGKAWILILFLMLSVLWAFFSIATQQNLYRARSVLFIEQVKSKVLSGKLEDVRDDQIKSIDMINTLVDLLRSYPFALRLVNHMKLTQDAEFLDAMDLRRDCSPEKAASVLMKKVNATYRLNTRLIDIYVTTSSPALSVKLANDFADEYLRYLHDQRSDATRSASSFLMEESDRLRKKMKASEEGMQKFRERERAASIDAMQLEAQTQINELSQRQTQIQSKLTQITSDLEIAKANTGNTKELLRLPSVAGETKVSTLVTQTSTLDKEFVLVKQRYRAKHPLYISVKTQLDLSNQELNKMLTDVVGLLDSIRTNLEAQQSAARADREAAEKRLLEVTAKSIEYNDLKREFDSDKALYESVLSRIKEVDVTKELSDSPVDLQEAATGAALVSKTPFVILTQSILFGLALGFALIIGLHRLDTSFKTVDQVEQNTHLPVVAAIPQIGGASSSRFGFLSKEQYQEALGGFRSAWKVLRHGSKQFPDRVTEANDILRPVVAMIGHPHRASSLPQGSQLVVKEDRGGVVAESFRSLRASVAMNIRAENQRVFLFTSAIPSEGKSFCSSNFATTLAQQGLKTLLIDADLRKPTISGIFFGSNRKPGLTEVLLRTKSLNEAVNPSGVDGLNVLTAGGRSSNPSELLAGQPFRDFIAGALLEYDRVVIDSAPVLAVSDTLLVAPEAQVLCLVVRSFMTSRKLVQRALKVLEEIHVRPTGIVLNFVPDGADSYYSGNYYGSYVGNGVYGSSRAD